MAVPADPQDSGAWLQTSSKTVALALNLVPFSGIAFLWFIGVLRDRLGALEDRFFATVFLGSGLLFLAMLFASAAMVGAIVIAFSPDPHLSDAGSFRLARAAAYNLVNIYMIKMAGVFMITTSTIGIYTKFSPLWLALVGYVLAGLLLCFSYYVSWSFMVFPVWVFLISLYILLENTLAGSAGAVRRL